MAAAFAPDQTPLTIQAEQLVEAPRLRSKSARHGLDATLGLCVNASRCRAGRCRAERKEMLPVPARSGRLVGISHPFGLQKHTGHVEGRHAAQDIINPTTLIVVSAAAHQLLAARRRHGAAACRPQHISYEVLKPHGHNTIMAVLSQTAKANVVQTASRVPVQRRNDTPTVRRFDAWRRSSAALLMLVVGRYQLRRPSIGWDENATVLISGRTLPQILDQAMNLDGVIAPYYAFMHFWNGDLRRLGPVPADAVADRCRRRRRRRRRPGR